jgi:hypothetical protein
VGVRFFLYFRFDSTVRGMSYQYGFLNLEKLPIPNEAEIFLLLFNSMTVFYMDRYFLNLRKLLSVRYVPVCSQFID